MGDISAIIPDPDRRLLQWFLVFTEPSKRHWWDRWLEPGFGHVYACRLFDEQLISINPRTDYLQIALEWPAIDNNGRLLVEWPPGASAVVNVIASAPKGRLRSRWFFGPITCVEVVKALLGIRAFWVFTPWQLYKYVRANHGVIRQTKDARTLGPRKGPRAPLAPP